MMRDAVVRVRNADLAVGARVDGAEVKTIIYLLAFVVAIAAEDEEPRHVGQDDRVGRAGVQQHVGHLAPVGS